MLKRQKGFTLSELLVSLAVLGLIAAVSIPSVYNSVKEQREKAVWKETIQIIERLYLEGAYNGNEGADLNGYVLDNVNATKLCSYSTNGTPEGCFHFYENTSGFELSNGAVINGIHPNSTDAHEYLKIDINGASPPNAENQDRMILLACIRSDCSTLNRNILGRVEPASSSYQNTYESIF